MSSSFAHSRLYSLYNQKLCDRHRDLFSNFYNVFLYCICLYHIMGVHIFKEVAEATFFHSLWTHTGTIMVYCWTMALLHEHLKTETKVVWIWWIFCYELLDCDVHCVSLLTWDVVLQELCWTACKWLSLPPFCIEQMMNQLCVKCKINSHYCNLKAYLLWLKSV